MDKYQSKPKDTEMGIFLLAVAVIVGVANMGFKQGQANPGATSLFDSHSTHVAQSEQ
jgi:hypothetical protein